VSAVGGTGPCLHSHQQSDNAQAPVIVHGLSSPEQEIAVGLGVARRPKIGTEISTSASGSIGTESLKSVSNSAVRPPDPLRDFNSRVLKSFRSPKVCWMLPIDCESRKASKPAKSALHVCAGRGSNKNKPRAGCALGVQVVATACRLFDPGGFGCRGMGMPPGFGLTGWAVYAKTFRAQLILRVCRYQP
jgi:hypothetical protein